MRVHETESQVILNGSRDINFTMDLVRKDLSLSAAAAERCSVPLQQFLDAHFVVRRNALQNAREGLDLDGVVAGYDLVMLAVDVRCHSHVRAALPGGLISEPVKRLLEIGAAHIARQSHRTSISSRTKCRRINPGRAAASSK